MKIINADKNSSIMDATKKINKANYIIPFEEVDYVFGKVIKFFFISNKNLLKQIVKQYEIDKNLLIYSFSEGRYSLYKLEWCI